MSDMMCSYMLHMVISKLVKQWLQCNDCQLQEIWWYDLIQWYDMIRWYDLIIWNVDMIHSNDMIWEWFDMIDMIWYCMIRYIVYDLSHMIWWIYMILILMIDVTTKIMFCHVLRTVPNGSGDMCSTSSERFRTVQGSRTISNYFELLRTIAPETTERFRTVQGTWWKPHMYLYAQQKIQLRYVIWYWYRLIWYRYRYISWLI